MNCADSTALRVHLDHPDPRLEAHLDGCATCAGLMESVAADMGATRQALDLLDHDLPARLGGAAPVEQALAAALERTRPAAVRATTTTSTAGPRRWSSAAAVRRLAVAASVVTLAAIVGLTPGGRDALAQVLDTFRGEQVQVVQFDPADIQLDPADVQALAALGEVDLAGLRQAGGPTEVADMTAAEARATISGPTLTDAPDQLVASAPATVSLTLRTRDGNGVPADLDGASLVVGVPGVIAAVDTAGDMPQLIIARIGTPTVDAVGAPLADIRAFLLDRPELPEALRAPLADIADWQTTLPLPVPIGGPGWQETTVAGRPALAFGDGSGLGAIVLRTDPDGFTVVGGPLPIEDALAIAEGA